jgi:hypothetical protein
MFRAYLLPIIMRYSLHVYSNWYVLCVWVTGGYPNVSHVPIVVHIAYSEYLLLMGNKCARNMYRLFE